MRGYARACGLKLGLLFGFLSLRLRDFGAFQSRRGHGRAVGPAQMVADWPPEHVAQHQLNDDDRNPEKTFSGYRHISLWGRQN